MKKLRKAFLPVTTFARIDVKRKFRDKVAIFFVFVFPLIFLFVFGGLFGGNNDVSFKVAVINQSSSPFSAKFAQEIKNNDVFDVNDKATTLDEAKQIMNRGQVDATIILPQGFGEVSSNKYPTGQAIILYDQNNEQAGQTLGSVMNAVFQDVNARFVKIETPFTVKTESTATKGQTRFDYTFAGLLGFSILSLGVFGPTNVFPRLKGKGVLRRYHTTTLKVWQYFIGNVMSNAVAGLLSVALMFVAAVVFFDLTMRGDYFSLITVVVLGTVLLFGIGLAIGGWAKNENQAAPLANLITFPMLFLSGVFFPVFLMPPWLQSITKYIPLTPVIDSIRYVVTEGKTLFELGPQLLVMGVWIIIVYIIAFRVFRWE